MGSLDIISSAVLLRPKDIREAIRNLLSTNDFDLISFDTSSAGNGILGFLGDHSRVTVEYTLNDITSKVTLFSKTYPANNIERAVVIDSHNMFEREATIYTKVFSKFTETEECKRWHPRCYHATNKALLFEDLNVKRFKMCRVKDVVDEKHCHVTLTSLARFHGATLIYEELHKDEIRLQKAFKDDLSEASFFTKDWFGTCTDAALGLAKLSKKYGITTPHYETVSARWYDVFESACRLSGPWEGYRNVLMHGDLWTNNLMYRYDAEGDPVQCVLVDFQISRFSPPSSDVMAFLYTNMTLEQLDKGMNAFLMYYYNELSTTLSDNGIDIEDVLSVDDFLKCCEMHRVWAMVQSLSIFQFTYVMAADYNDAMNRDHAFKELIHGNRTDILADLMEIDPIFKHRMMSLIDEFIERYIITC